MIFDSCKNVEAYYGISEKLDKALTYLKEMNLKDLNFSKKEIDDSGIFVIYQEYSTKNLNEGKWEAHRKYIDIQYIISGCEKMGYCPIDNLTPATEYNDETDFISYKGNSDNYLVVKEGNFAVFMPQDGHMPGLNVNESMPVKKIIFKIPV